MRILYIIFYNLKRNFRDKKDLINMILIPSIFIFILGMALKNAYIPENIKKAKVYYYSEDNKSISDGLYSYISCDRLKHLVDVTKVCSKKEGLDLIKKDKYATFVYVPNDFSKDISEGKKQGIFLYNEKGTIQTQIVKNILEGFASNVNSIYAIYSIGGQAKYVPTKNTLVTSKINIHGKTPRAIDYYAITMLVMTLMYGASYGKYAIEEIYNQEAGKRIQIAPIKKFEVLIGYISSSVITVFASGILIMIIAKYIFKANYGNNMPLIIFIIFTMSVLSNFIGMTIGVIKGNHKGEFYVVDIIVIVCTFVSGGYTPMNINNHIYNKVIKFVPNMMAHNAMFNCIYGFNKNIVISSILSMWIAIIFLITISSLLARKREG
ncbi:ABC transporter permease [Clostridium massiliodielmoense]|uniref:ABC transporter permease n=1 Tax=Clostridium massiliodielmoense TaxID=1776385 RepID=UPI000166A462|nr:ABC transporter permease [Clostridium massiliodielmoense]EDS78514.1 ABC-2 type transporter [Clostridium botulinum C str. Eklund]KEH99308.1 permease [Clostridium botulinum C/D str. BKT12695]NEZ49224.1 ABC transporter permease [Clostridium botulinum]